MTNPNEEMLLTEDGHPIGEVVLADNAAVPVDDNPRRIEENRLDLLRQKAQELTGEPDADVAIMDLYPGYADTDKMRRAMALVVAEGKSIEDAAEAVGVPGRTVSMWCHVGDWSRLVRDEIRARHEQSLMQLARERSERRVRIAKEQLEQAKEIRDAAVENLVGPHGGVSKAAADAWNAASKVEQTLLGMSESGAVVDTEGKEEEKKADDGGKRPLVMVFQNGGLPPVRRA